MNFKKLTLTAPDIPERLHQIAVPPKRLFVLGDLAPLLEQPCLAVVGSRKVTPYGRDITGKLVREVAGKGVTIISGLALGVDSLAHEATLDAKGKTIAVLPSGLEKIYPATHHHLAKQILQQGGALISEYSEGVEAFKTNFVERNRLVSGLSDGVLITEAAEKSGTLHTANFALEQGRTVMVVPGNITSPMSKGTNNLLKSGALPITDASDILFGLGLKEIKPAEQAELFGDTKEETDILTMMQAGTTDAALLQQASGLSPQAFNQTITMLEINGRIRPLGAGHWTLS